MIKIDNFHDIIRTNLIVIIVIANNVIIVRRKFPQTTIGRGGIYNRRTILLYGSVDFINYFAKYSRFIMVRANITHK